MKKITDEELFELWKKSGHHFYRFAKLLKDYLNGRN